MAVSATNLLGAGPTSHPVSIELHHYNSTSKEICPIIRIIMYVFISIGGNESSSCEGFKSDLDTPLFIGIGAVTITLITITIFMTIIIIVLIRGKAQLQMKLETSKIDGKYEDYL